MPVRIRAAMGIVRFARGTVPLAVCLGPLVFQTDETAVRTVAQGTEGALEAGFRLYPDETVACAHMAGNREQLFKGVDTQLQMLDFRPHQEAEHKSLLTNLLEQRLKTTL